LPITADQICGLIQNTFLTLISAAVVVDWAAAAVDSSSTSLALLKRPPGRAMRRFLDAFTATSVAAAFLAAWRAEALVSVDCNKKRKIQ
jgi:hypothetical protein